MQVIVKMDGVRDQPVTVRDTDDASPNGNWVHDTIEACWEWVQYHGSGSATAYDERGARVCTVTLELHDE